MSDGELCAAIAAGLEAGHGVATSEGPAVLVLATLPSGARIALDAEAGTWILPDGDGPPAKFGPGTEGRFVEAMEVPRRDFEDLLEAGAKAAGLPVDPAVVAFPALALLRAILQMSAGYTARLALKWLLPSERLPLKAEIAALPTNPDMPHDVRGLARHLAG